MVGCSVCSLMNALFRVMYNAIATAMEYPMVVFFFSFLLAVALIFNVHMAKLMCDLSEVATGRRSVSTISFRTENNVSSLTNNLDYGVEHGPHTWSCEGQHQSPINIRDKYIKKLPIRELLTWNHYDDLPSSMTMENAGHTIKATYSGNTPTLSGADLLSSYTFVQICFRWSLLNNEGSEHMINYKKFPLELQALHRTGLEGDCVSSYDLLMVAYFFELATDNPYLDPIVQNLHRIRIPGSKVIIPPFPLSYLCHQFRSRFYSYGGSITEPPCYQGAEWFIYPEPFAISERQLNEFRQILSSNGTTRIIRNARPVQNINCSRVVNLNEYNPSDTLSAAELSLNSSNSDFTILN